MSFNVSHLKWKTLDSSLKTKLLSSCLFLHKYVCHVVSLVIPIEGKHLMGVSEPIREDSRFLRFALVNRWTKHSFCSIFVFFILQFWKRTKFFCYYCTEKNVVSAHSCKDSLRIFLYCCEDTIINKITSTLLTDIKRAGLATITTFNYYFPY